ncbi:hypothetical protein JCM9957A_29220 [Kineosporia succinea]
MVVLVLSLLEDAVVDAGAAVDDCCSTAVVPPTASTTALTPTVQSRHFGCLRPPGLEEFRMSGRILEPVLSL